MDQFDKIKSLLFRFEDLGIEHMENGVTCIGHVPEKGKNAWLNKIYPVLSNYDVEMLELSLNRVIPADYRSFLMVFSNGLNVLLSTFSLYGLRKTLGRSILASQQPYSILTLNMDERPKNARDNLFFIGSYNWNGSLLYIDPQTNYVHCCQREDITSRVQWPSLEIMILSEIHRLNSLFNDQGSELNDKQSMLPYE